jgi:hypothetical protein
MSRNNTILALLAIAIGLAVGIALWLFASLVVEINLF